MIILISLLNFLVKDISLPVGFSFFPVKEVEFIKKNNLKGKVLTNFGIGSYTAYKLYPQNLIYMDGRYEEVYYDFAIPMLKEFFMAYPHWTEMFQYFPPDIIIVEKSYPIYGVLDKSRTWKLVYKGEVFGVFLPIDKTKRQFIMPTDDIEYYKNTLFDTDIKF